MTGRLDGKVVIIAGAASRGEGVGTGHAMAVLSAREGAKVVLVNRTADRAEMLREEITAEGGDAMVFMAMCRRKKTRRPWLPPRKNATAK